MSDLIINGYGRYMVRVEDGDDSVNYTMPKAGAGGIAEHNILEDNVIKKVTIGRKLKYKYFGVRKKFIIDHSAFLAGNYCKYVAKFTEAQIAGKGLVLYPRAMNSGYFYPVYLDNAELILGLMRGGVNAQGMKGIILEFITIDIYKVLNWRTLREIVEDWEPTGEGATNII